MFCAGEPAETGFVKAVLVSALLSLTLATGLSFGFGGNAQAQILSPDQSQTLAAAGERTRVTAFKQAVAEAASSDKDIATFYREND